MLGVGFVSLRLVFRVGVLAVWYSGWDGAIAVRIVVSLVSVTFEMVV